MTKTRIQLVVATVVESGATAQHLWEFDSRDDLDAWKERLVPLVEQAKVKDVDDALPALAGLTCDVCGAAAVSAVRDVVEVTKPGDDAESWSMREVRARCGAHYEPSKRFYLNGVVG